MPHPDDEDRAFEELAELFDPPTLNGRRELRAVPWSTFRDMPDPETTWLVRGLVPAGGLAVLGSSPKAGKTWLALALAVSVTTGRAFLGRFVVPEPAGVHYLALEGSCQALRHRVGALARGVGVDPDGDELDELHVSCKLGPVSLTDPESAALYCAEVLACGARLAIIDTARRAARIRESGEGVGDLAVLAANLAPLTRNGVTVLFLHHARKVSSERGWTPPLERLSGSGDWVGICEVGFILDRRKGADWRDCRLEVEGRDLPAYPVMHVVYEGRGSHATEAGEPLIGYEDTLVARCEDADEAEGGVELAAKVAEWLATRPRVEATRTELTMQFNVDRKTIPSHHDAFSKQGIAWDEPERGKVRVYWLASPAHERLRSVP